MRWAKVAKEKAPLGDCNSYVDVDLGPIRARVAKEKTPLGDCNFACRTSAVPTSPDCRERKSPARGLQPQVAMPGYPLTIWRRERKSPARGLQLVSCLCWRSLVSLLVAKEKALLGDCNRLRPGRAGGITPFQVAKEKAPLGDCNKFQSLFGCPNSSIESQKKKPR